MSKYKSSMEHCPYTCITTDKKALTHKDIMKLLNEQDQRITELESTLKHCKDATLSDLSEIKLLQKENNILNKRIQELESQLEFWKGSAGVCQGELGIVNNELGIALEQGYKLSDAYMEYKEDKEKGVQY